LLSDKLFMMILFSIRSYAFVMSRKTPHRFFLAYIAEKWWASLTAFIAQTPASETQLTVALSCLTLEEPPDTAFTDFANLVQERDGSEVGGLVF